MIIKKAILHIMDFNSDMCVFSTKELDIGDFGTGEFIDKHVSKLWIDSASRKGEFLDHSIFKQLLDKYKNDTIDFTEFSTSIGNLLHEQLASEDEPESVDFLVCQYNTENNEYLALLLLPNKIAYTHQVISTEDGVSNKIIRYYTLLPNTTQKITSFAVINMKDYSIKLGDKKRTIMGEEELVLPDKVLQCTYNQSQQETMKVIKKITSQVAEEHGANVAIAVTRAKNRIIESAEQKVPFSPSDICEEVFHDNEVMKTTFKQKAMEANVPAKIEVENPKVIKAAKSHKIKTDTGIEIKIPTEFLENNRYVEFINNPDGTLSISIKNIGKIVNK